MKRLVLPLLLAGCSVTNVPLEALPEEPVLDLVVRTANKYYMTVAAKQVAHANRLLGESVHLEATYSVGPEVPTHYERYTSELRSDKRTISVHVSVSAAITGDEGLEPVEGVLVKDREGWDWCRDYIVLSGEELSDCTLAHEVGHLLGLEHRYNSANVMAEDADNNTSFDALQLFTMHHQAASYHESCWE